MVSRNEIADGCRLMQNEKQGSIYFCRTIIIYKWRLNNKTITIAMKAGWRQNLFTIKRIRPGVFMIGYNIMQPLFRSNAEYKNTQHQSRHYTFYDRFVIHQ